MLKRWMQLALVAVITLGITACAARNPGGDFAVATQKPAGAQVQQTPEPTVEPYADPAETDWDNAGYDPGAEDGDVPEELLEKEAPVVVATYYPYAGATPMLLDPIDKPSPTPRPALAFTSYQTYEATKLGLSFEAPTGWIVDDSAADSYTITDPQMWDNYQAYLTIQVQSISKAYSASDLKAEVKAMFASISAKNYSAWQPSSVDPRKMMGQEGMYGNYAGTLVDGTRVRGRVTAISTNNKLIIVHISDPANFNSDYLAGVYKKVESTLTETR